MERIGTWPTVKEARDGLFLLLDLDFGGETIRLSDRVYSPYDPGLLEVDFERQLDFFSTALPDLSATVTCDLPFDVTEAWLQGIRLADATATLAVTAQGRSLEEKHVFLRGHVTEPEWSENGQPARFRITRAPHRDRSLHPDATARIDIDTWEPPSLDASVQGWIYPTIGGRPSYNPGSDTAYLASPARCCRFGISGQPGVILIAGHACGPHYSNIARLTGSPAVTISGASCGGWVRVHDTSTGQFDLREVYNVRDGLGRIVAVVQSDNVGSGGPLDPVDGSHTYVVAWHGGSHSHAQGIDLDPFTWALKETRVDIDRSMVRRANHLKFGWLIEERVDLLEWLSDNFTPLGPFSLIETGVGLALDVWDAQASRRTDIILQEGVNVHRTRIVEDYQPVHDCTVRFCLQYGGEHARVATVKNTASRRKRTTRYTDEIESDVIVRDADAAWVAGWRLRTFAEPALELTMDGGPELWALRPGDIVRYNDPERWVTITKVRYGLGGIELAIRLVA